MGLAGVVWSQLLLTDFTLAWTHSIEKIRWEEDYRVTPSGLLLGEARVKGSGEIGRASCRERVYVLV